MDKIDFKKTDKPLYTGKVGRWDRVDVPAMNFVMIDGQGAPGGAEYVRALGALYPLAYGLKFHLKARDLDFAVPPLEALWFADDPSVFVTDQRDEWKWRAMLRVRDEITDDDFAAVRASALAKLAKKKDPQTDAATMNAVRLERWAEGDCLQTLHVGPYSAEAPVLADLHSSVMPEMGLTFGGDHHEIYLGDPRRVAPEKLRTILRQPVQPLG